MLKESTTQILNTKQYSLVFSVDFPMFVSNLLAVIGFIALVAAFSVFFCYLLWRMSGHWKIPQMNSKWNSISFNSIFFVCAFVSISELNLLPLTDLIASTSIVKGSEVTIEDKSCQLKDYVTESSFKVKSGIFIDNRLCSFKNLFSPQANEDATKVFLSAGFLGSKLSEDRAIYFRAWSSYQYPVLNSALINTLFLFSILYFCRFLFLYIINNRVVGNFGIYLSQWALRDTSS